ncbi:Plasmodium vivax Vir protein, putative [Plasmodium vivax]|uniref:Vir protein, putative n=1 Tax=Plasmodium vivax TaxID=5855 RepID=A0A1G4EAQ3_PLAVI|nr:Plasmodium vivax Vir protein, putative [Plasmodium vivax]
MTKEKKTYTFSDLKEDNDVLIFSNINRLYVAFFDYECDNREESNLFCSSDNSYGSISPSLLDLYKKFERNITSIWGESSYAYNHIENNKIKLCIYLKYWLYDQLIESKVNKDDFTKFFNLWDKQKKEKCSACECEFPIKEFSEIQQIKKIYDFFLFLDSYKDKEKIINVISNKEYCKYIDASKSLYYLYQMKCEKSNNLLLSHYVDRLSPIGRPEENDRVDQEEGEEDTEGDHPPPRPLTNSFAIPPLDGPHIISSSSFISTDDAVGQHLQPTQEENAEGVTDLLAPDSSYDGKSTGTIISASSVGTVGFLFLLYKFTPLRSMLDPRIRKTRNNLMNGVQGSHELQSQDYDLYSQDAPFNRYNIGYQSS